MSFHRSFLVAGAIALSTFATASRAVVVFDNYTTIASKVSTSSTPNTFMGDGFVLASGTVDITGFDLYAVNATGTNFNALKLNFYVWGTVNTGTVSASAPAFSNLLGAYSLTSTGTFTTGFYYSFEGATPGVTPGITLGTALNVTGPNVGITVNYQGSTDGGLTYASASSLTSLISAGAPASVGSEMFNGYYRNANNETNGNFTSTLRALSYANQSIAMRIYGDVSAVPEPGTWATMGIGALALLALRRRRG